MLRPLIMRLHFRVAGLSVCLCVCERANIKTEMQTNWQQQEKQRINKKAERETEGQM